MMYYLIEWTIPEGGQYDSNRGRCEDVEGSDIVYAMTARRAELIVRAARPGIKKVNRIRIREDI